MSSKKTAHGSQGSREEPPFQGSRSPEVSVNPKQRQEQSLEQAVHLGNMSLDFSKQMGCLWACGDPMDGVFEQSENQGMGWGCL